MVHVSKDKIGAVGLFVTNLVVVIFESGVNMPDFKKVSALMIGNSINTYFYCCCSS